MMKKARFTESQIVSILKLADSGMKIDEICRQNGISNAIYYIYGLPPTWVDPLQARGLITRRLSNSNPNGGPDAMPTRRYRHGAYLTV